MPPTAITAWHLACSTASNVASIWATPAMTSPAAAGYRFQAMTAWTKGGPKGGLCLSQRIFGINTLIRAVCVGYAADGYYCVAPGRFGRVERGVYLGYTGDDVARGRDLRGKMTWDACMKDVGTAVAAASTAGRVGTVGYCYGGGVTWMADRKSFV